MAILEEGGVTQGTLIQNKHAHNNGRSPAEEGRGRGGHFAGDGC